jgi:hypothetical protein
MRDQQLALVGTVLLFLDAIHPVSARTGAANGSPEDPRRGSAV